MVIPQYSSFSFLQLIGLYNPALSASFNKNLKLSESINNRTPKQIAELLEDVFVEIFDKWEIKEIPVVNYHTYFNQLFDDGQFFADLETEDLYYRIRIISNKVILKIQSNIFQPSSIERFKEMVRDCQPVLTRLKSFGIDFHWDSQRSQNPYDWGRLEYFRVVVELPNKVSESYHNDEISKSDYFHLMGDTYDPLLKKVLPFDDSEFESIKSICQPLGLSVLLGPSRKHMTVFYKNTPRISIEKIDDEWYICNYIRENKYIKCDTFDGLIKELKRYLD